MTFQRETPPEAESIISLTRIAGILALVIGIIMLIVGAITFFFFIGVFLIALGVVDILIYTSCNEIVRLVESGDYRRAKEKTLIWMILGFIFSWIIVGILLLIAYVKYDELIRRYQALPTLTTLTQPPQPF